MENIEVGLRIRPLNQMEQSTFERNPWMSQSADSIIFDVDQYEHVIKHNKITQLNLKNPIKFSKKPYYKKYDQYFNEDYCFDETTTNADIYSKMVQDVIYSGLEGINGKDIENKVIFYVGLGTVFMYGQTGSGKTFTMLGSVNEQPNYAKIPNSKKIEIMIFFHF